MVRLELVDNATRTYQPTQLEFTQGARDRFYGATVSNDRPSRTTGFPFEASGGTANSVNEGEGYRVCPQTSGNCILTNTCGGTEDQAEVWGPNVFQN